ncbi:DNA-binding response regulator [Teredinibacter haidensis]|uniref:response regulator transcription factor n=1 Tax=Teredinibacter haidensis TaxID=2731755 RepID=UPI000948F5C1|nr:DNA-binding response regulator [Teredinibacter haidensis]
MITGELILIVDDSPETLGMLNESLESAGMTTLVALDGKQALSICSKMVPDIILLDAIMPVMDGFETCMALKRNSELHSVPIIFMTGLTDTDSILKGFNAGGVDYLTKPINPIELIARMKTHLTNSRLTRHAEKALDSAGQNVFTVDETGAVQWATSFVMQTIERANSEKSSKQITITSQIKSWLSRSPVEGNKLELKTSTLTLSVVYMGNPNTNEILLRLIDEEKVNPINILKDTFPVTQRESEVLVWIAKGKTNREIAQILEMSPRTVNKHLEQIFKKLNVDNRTSAASLAIDALQKKRHY